MSGYATPFTSTPFAPPRLHLYPQPEPTASTPLASASPQPPPQPHPQPSISHKSSINTYRRKSTRLWTGTVAPPLVRQTEPTAPHQQTQPRISFVPPPLPMHKSKAEPPAEANAHEPTLTEASSAQPPPQPSTEEVGPQPPPQPAADATHTPAQSEPSVLPAKHEHQGVLEDDGSRRWFMHQPLRGCPEAYEACRQDLDELAVKGSDGKRKRKRNKDEKKSEVRGGRGPGKSRGVAMPDDRPKLVVVGDAEFASSPWCTKVVTTVRLLTLANLPGPCRSYNMFPTKTRLEILRQFMQRYTWGADEDIRRCLAVFENIAAEAYSRELMETRRACRRKFGEDKELWKGFPPRWCRNNEHYSACAIFGPKRNGTKCRGPIGQTEPKDPIWFIMWLVRGVHIVPSKQWY